jgi:serine/threonine-protein kinase
MIAAALAAVVLIVAGTSYALWFEDSAPAYAAQTLVHEHGQATLTEQPRAVIAAGPGDADAVLSLDVQPVAIVAPGGELPSWEKDLITGDVRVLPTADAAALAGAQPDLILDTGEIDGATYRALSGVATTITRPQDASDWTWQTQLQWTARILGHEQRAKDLIDKAAAAQADLRSQHPVFDGKSVEVVLVTDDGISIASPTSPAARYLQGLGFRYPAKPAVTSTDGADMQPVADPEQLNLTPTDVRIVLRTDRTAGNGSYNGLPQPFSAYRGATIIVDDPAAITALQSPGYAAVNYLNTGLVNALARQVR